MKNQLDYSEFIERYLDGGMSGHELIWFEKELDSNSWLQTELNLRKKVNKAILEDKFIRYRDELEEVYSSAQDQEKRLTGKSKKIILSSSLIVTLLIGAFLIFHVSMRNVSNERIFSTYYKPFEANMTFRSANTELNTSLKKAMQLYENKDYAEASILFEDILRSDPSRIGLNLYSGISKMEIHEYENAGTSFNKVINDKFNLYIEQAEWYLSLCYIVTEQDDKAVQLLNKIVNNKSFNYKDARKILRKLN